jgi:hypothetical protein
MNIPIEKRIARLEGELLPKKLPKLRIIYEPLRDADAGKWAAYNAEMKDAQRMDEQAIVVCAYYKPGRENLPGMCFVNAKWEADLAILASQPSERGNKDALDDLLKSLGGNVLGVAKNPKPDIHQIQAMRRQ